MTTPDATVQPLGRHIASNEYNLHHMQIMCILLQTITTLAPHHSVFTSWMLFLMPIQQCQSTEGTEFGWNTSLTDDKLPHGHTRFHMITWWELHLFRVLWDGAVVLVTDDGLRLLIDTLHIVRPSYVVQLRLDAGHETKHLPNITPDFVASTPGFVYNQVLLLFVFPCPPLLGWSVMSVTLSVSLCVSML